MFNQISRPLPKYAMSSSVRVSYQQESILKLLVNKKLRTSNMFYYAARGWDSFFNGLYVENPPKRGTLYRLQAYERAAVRDFAV